jgi:hypothetical protein
MRNLRTWAVFASVPAVLALVAAGGEAARAQGLNGQTVEVTFDGPTAGTVITDVGSEVVTPAGFFANYNTDVVTEVLPDEIILAVNRTKPIPSGAFEGLVFTETGGSPATVLSATLAQTSIAGLTTGDITHTGDSVFVNLQGLILRPDHNAIIDLTTRSAAPEPGSAALIGLGLPALVSVLRRRRVAVR